MDFLIWLTQRVDIFLIAPYRWPENPLTGWWLGTFILAVWSTVLGEITMALAFRANRSYLKGLSQKMVQRHIQSINALKAGNKEAYSDIYRLANEAYGKTFFNQLAMAASSLWPAPLALAWLQCRFSDVTFLLPFNLPLVGEAVSYPFIFIPLYILTKMFFGKIREHLPLFSG